MQAANVSSPVDAPCAFCLDQTINGPVGQVFVTACCKKMLHDVCWKQWEDSPSSGEPPAGYISNRPLVYRRCLLCQQNAAPLIHLSTVAYQNSKINYFRDDEVNAFLQQLVSDSPAGGAAVDHARLRNSMRIPTLTELVEGEMNLVNEDMSGSSGPPPLFRPRQPAIRSICVEPFLLQACQTGDPELITAIVNAHPDAVRRPIYSPGRRRRLPMSFVAADNGHLPSVRIMIRANSQTFPESLSIAMDGDNHRALQTLVSVAQTDDGPTQALLASKVHQAALNGDQETLTKLFRAGTKIDEVISSAAADNNLDILCELIKAGNSKIDVLYQLARKNASELLTRLIGTDTDSDDGECAATAALLAAVNQDVQTLEVLKSAGVELEYVLLGATQCSEDDNTIKTLLSAGASAHKALSLAADMEDGLLFTSLLNSLDTDPAVFLPTAAERGDLDMIKKLLEAGANPDTGFADGAPLTPLFIAAGNDHKAVVDAIFTCCATSDPQYRSTMIYRAALEADNQTLRCMLDTHSGSEQNISDLTCVLQQAIDDKDNGDGRYVLTRLTQIGRSGKVGKVLMKLISNGDAQTLASLLQLGANPNYAKNDGWSLLHAAASTGEPELVKLLLDHGAAVHQLTSSSASALSVAVSLDSKSVVTTLVQAGGSKDINSAVRAAIERQDNDTLGLLIGMNDLSGPEFRQLLISAARNGDTDAVKTMVQSRHAISSDIAFFQAFNDSDQELITAFLKAGMGKSGPSATSFLLMAAVKGNAAMVATMIRHGTDFRRDIYQAAAALEIDALAIMLSAFVECNPQEGADELLEELIRKAIADHTPHVFLALVSADQRTGAVNIGNVLLTAVEARSEALDELKIAQDRKACALIERYKHDEELARKVDAEDDSIEEAWQASKTIENRINDYDHSIRVHEKMAGDLESAIQSFVQAGAIRAITAESAQVILTSAVRSHHPEIVKEILDSWSEQDSGQITAETRRVASGALLLAIEAQDWNMVRLLTSEAPIDCAMLNDKRTVLYDVAKSQDSELLGALWRLGVLAAPSLHSALTDTNRLYLQYFIEAGITLDDNDNDVDIHPLVTAIQICADHRYPDHVKSVLDITKNVDTVIYNQALLNHKHLVAVIWHHSGKQHQQIMGIIKRAVTTDNEQIIETLQQIKAIAPQLGQCLFDAAQAGDRDVARALIASKVDIHESMHNPARFLYLSACADPQIAETILNAWKNKNNRDTPVIIKEACDIAKREQSEKSQDICDFFNGLAIT